MAVASQAMISANTCTFSSPRIFKKFRTFNRPNFKLFTLRASANEDDCNDEECAPEKEVGSVSMEWLAGEKTKVVGTFPFRKRGWTGFVEKDTAGQNNVYSVHISVFNFHLDKFFLQPAVYVSETAVSSGSAGSSASGAENTAGLVGFLGLIAVAASASILIQVGKNPVDVQTTEYSGPSLSYYINKFKPPEIVETSAPIPTESAPPVEVEAPLENSGPVESSPISGENSVF